MSYGVYALVDAVSDSLNFWKMNSNRTSEFLAALANNRHTSKAQSPMLLARKLAERMRRLRKMRNTRQRLRQLARDLMTDEVVLSAIDDDINRLQEAVNMGMDENDA